MGLVDLLIIAVVAAALILCVRSIRRGDGSCSSCAQGPTCAVRASGRGRCPVADDMVAKADAALGRRPKA